tara:strand:- start:63 stop:590 length:528 start_codon:yes stop_codon:yes gene_type:complete
MGKNIKKIQDMLTGDYQSKIQVGYGDQSSKHHAVGDKWTDSDGVEWEQKNGFYTKVNKLPAVGIFSKNCKECGKNCSKTNGDIRHFDTWKRMERCFHCQINFESDLKAMKIGENGNKWIFWVKLQMLKRWETIDQEVQHLVFENSDVKVNDKALMNALANENVRQAREDVKKSSQ